MKSCTHKSTYVQVTFIRWKEHSAIHFLSAWQGMVRWWWNTAQVISEVGKRPGTSCKIEIHFWFKITQYLINGFRLSSQICPRYSFLCATHRHKVSNSFTKQSGRDMWLKVQNWISILSVVPVLLLTIRSPGAWR
jgi:hypothetical protein